MKENIEEETNQDSKKKNLDIRLPRFYKKKKTTSCREDSGRTFTFFTNLNLLEIQNASRPSF